MPDHEYLARLESENAALRTLVVQLGDRLRICSELLGRAAARGKVSEESVKEFLRRVG